MLTEPNVGRVLQNRYRLLRLLGQGAMGQVYAAEDTALGGIPVAVKFLSQTLLNNKMRDRFEREAKTCAQLGQRSMHIVRVTDYGVDEEGVPFYVMEYLKGESLSEVIGRQMLSLSRFLSLTRQICLGLQCAHEGIQIDGKLCPIVHRDIKPSNILVSQNDSMGELVKILDFGIAKVLEPEGNQTQCFMGTLAYSSPEQMEGRELDSRSDIYSLGVMMFQMLTGRMPLNVDTHSFGGWYKAHHFQVPRSFESVSTEIKVPKALEKLVMDCLAKLPSDRPQSIADVLKALEPFDERLGTGRQIAQRINASLSRLPIIAEPKTDGSAIGSELCRAAIWPDTMPIAEIVFPRAMPTPEGNVPALWVMMTKQEIQRRLICTRYNQFLFLEAPHPMALWLTVLYNREHGPRWLPCYLDLKTAQGRQIANVLANVGQYSILFFAQENHQRCTHVQTSSVNAAQCRLLHEWALIGQASKGPANPNVTKNHLRSALENMKPQILLKLEAIYGTKSSFENGSIN
jgi:serine/threonine-protein kinase